MNTFNKASKITVTILLLALALSLGACSSSQNSVSPKDDSVTSSPISESETLPAAESQQGGNLSLITDPYGGIFRNGAGTSFGYYEIMSAQNNSLNILYTDYATDIRTYLCADPDCTHNSDTCTSWFSFLGSAYPFTSADGSKIYLDTRTMLVPFLMSKIMERFTNSMQMVQIEKYYIDCRVMKNFMVQLPRMAKNYM